MEVNDKQVESGKLFVSTTLKFNRPELTEEGVTQSLEKDISTLNACNCPVKYVHLGVVA